LIYNQGFSLILIQRKTIQQNPEGVITHLPGFVKTSTSSKTGKQLLRFPIVDIRTISPGQNIVGAGFTNNI
jgi:hypothetical protein